MKVYLDDARPTPPGWVRTYTAPQTIALIETGEVEELSLDHDLGGDNDPEIGTGYDVCCYLEERAYRGLPVPPVIHVHSANLAGRLRMKAALRKMESYL